MASLVLKMSVSLDGFVAPLDGSSDWIAAGRSADGASWTVETLSNAGAHLIGAATYAGWATYLPGAPGPLAAPGGAAPPCAGAARAVAAKGKKQTPPRFFFPNSLASADWGETEIA